MMDPVVVAPAAPDTMPGTKATGSYTTYPVRVPGSQWIECFEFYRHLKPSKVDEFSCAHEAHSNLISHRPANIRHIQNQH